MSESQLRVKLLVAAGIVGASLLGASFVGCSTPSNSPFASYNGSPMAPGGGMPGAMGPGGMGPQGMAMGPAAAPGVDGYSQQNRQAFMAETQRMGGQQNLSAQDVVAMSRSGVPDAQIAIAVQQRGAALRATPGADRFLASNGVNPAVLGTSPAGMPPAGYGPQMQMAAAPQQPGYPPAGMQFAQAGPAPGAGPAVTAGMQQPAGAGPGVDSGVQSAAYQMSGGTPGSDPSAAAGSQSWRPMSH